MLAGRGESRDKGEEPRIKQHKGTHEFCCNFCRKFHCDFVVLMLQPDAISVRPRQTVQESLDT